MGIEVIGSSGAASSKIEVTKEFTSTTNWTAPDDVNEIYVLAYGGGGGGMACSTYSADTAQGGSGSAFETLISVSPGQTYSISIGGGGAKTDTNSANAVGVQGGTTSIGNIFSLPGGEGGITSSSDQADYYQHDRSGHAKSGGRGGFNSNVTNNQIPELAGKGLYGRGGGGGSYRPGYRPALGVDMAGTPRLHDSNNNNQQGNLMSPDGQPNSGAGGGSKIFGNVSLAEVSQMSGNGGSGFVRIKYWTAG